MIRFSTVSGYFAILCMFFSLTAECREEKESVYSVNALSFVYHAYVPHRSFNQYFNNDLISVERNMDPVSRWSLIGGTIINSDGSRCVLLGGGKEYWREGRWSVDGMYMYAGEFFIKPFSHCGDDGYYHKLKELTGVGFAPYIYHGVKYDFTRDFSIKGGVILPGIVVLNLQIRF